MGDMEMEEAELWPAAKVKACPPLELGLAAWTCDGVALAAGEKTAEEGADRESDAGRESPGPSGFMKTPKGSGQASSSSGDSGKCEQGSCR
jgi:hypothetical protein